MAKKQEAEQPQQPQPQNQNPNLIQYKNGSVTDADAANKPSAVKAIMRDLGLEDKFVKDVMQDIIKQYAKEAAKDALGLGRTDKNKPRQKEDRSVVFIRTGVIWLLVGIFGLMMLVILYKYVTMILFGG